MPRANSEVKVWEGGERDRRLREEETERQTVNLGFCLY